MNVRQYPVPEMTPGTVHIAASIEGIDVLTCCGLRLANDAAHATQLTPTAADCGNCLRLHAKHEPHALAAPPCEGCP